MKRNVVLLCLCFSLFFTACNNTSPERYFGIAVLNSNSFMGFADEGQLRQMQSPSAKADANGNPVAMKRKEELDQKIFFMEEELAKLKDLEETDETKEMLQASLALFEYVIPVYKNEYAQLANLYDMNAEKSLIDSKSKSIHDKYFTRYDELYNKLIVIGKLYAKNNSIKVNWNVGG
jgi:bacterioferritin (cytochrome b1)